MKTMAIFTPEALDTTPTGPRAIPRVLQVMSYLAEHPEGRTLMQLCESLKLPKTTLFTMLKTLQSAGYLELFGSLYRLGPPAVTLGAAMAASARQNFPECAREVLESLCRRTGETGLLAVLTADGMACRYVTVLESANWLRFTVQHDSLKPAYATGTGHAMLAYLPPDELKDILRRIQFEKITSKTISSRRALAAELSKVRREHVSTADSGTVAGVLSVAAPIFDVNGRIAAAISAGGPAARMAHQLPAIQRAVRSAAEEVSRTLGYLGDWPPT